LVTLKPHVLIIDDESGPRESLRMILKPDYEIAVAENAQKAMRALGSKPFDLVTLDKRLPDMDGLEVLSRIRQEWPSVRVIMITADMSSEIFKEAHKRGVNHFIVKPFDVDQVRLAVQQQVEEKHKEDENVRLHRQIEGLEAYTFGRLVGSSKAMRQLFDTIEHVSKSDATVLLHGESGTGKELVARAVHDHSPRSKGPYMPVHCAAIAKELLESELFGHEKGSFTGAMTQRVGMFEAADAGTLFLDEIGEMELGLQAKLLRAIQEREIRRVGGNSTVKIDVRIICATNRNLEKEVREQRFREDLFYRINVVPIRLPPLRERKEDIALLVSHFTERFARELQKPPKKFTAAALDVLGNYPWPGNVRELQHCIERIMVILDADKIQPQHLQPILGRGAGEASSVPQVGSPAKPAILEPGKTLDDLVNDLERQAILAALAEYHGILTDAAAKLGITRRVLKYKMSKLGIDSPEDDSEEKDELQTA